jgi:creatinine amidohydrolase
LALHLRPEAVRRERIADPHNDRVDWDDPDLDFGRYSSTGVIGRPTVASAALGGSDLG